MSQFRAQIFREITTSIKQVSCRVYCRYRMIYPELKWILTRNGNELLTLYTVLNFFFPRTRELIFFKQKCIQCSAQNLLQLHISLSKIRNE